MVKYDPTEFSIVYSCTNYFGGAFILEDFWVLTREAVALDTEKWNEMWSRYTQIISEKLPFFDQDRIMPT